MGPINEYKKKIKAVETSLSLYRTSRANLEDRISVYREVKLLDDVNKEFKNFDLEADTVTETVLDVKSNKDHNTEVASLLGMLNDEDEADALADMEEELRLASYMTNAANPSSRQPEAVVAVQAAPTPTAVLSIADTEADEAEAEIARLQGGMKQTRLRPTML
jgi:hypothetical protein